MAITDPQVGEFARYYPNGPDGMAVLVEIVSIGLGQAWRGGERDITCAVVERSQDGCFLTGEQVIAYEHSADIGPALARTPKRLHLPTTTLWGCFRAGQLWDWYGYGPAWIPETLDEALHGTPISARLFGTRDLAEEYLAASHDAVPGDAVGEVTAKTWSSQYQLRPEGPHVRYARALILNPDLPRPA